MGMGGHSTSRPGGFTPGEENGYPLCRKLGGPHGQSHPVLKISSPAGLDYQTVQSVAPRDPIGR
jgi:hypothetical protein